jgi:hypothetical protein
MDEQPSAGMPDTYDRLMSGLSGLPGVINTKPSTVRTTVPILGSSQTWVISTFRQRQEKADGKAIQSRDSIFLETMSREGMVRLVIPPAVAEAISRQRDSLTKRSRRAAGRANAAERKARGELPGFMKRKKA